MHKESQIYKQLGGEDAISGIVDLFYARILSDPLLSPYFEGIDMARQRAHQRDFLIYALGGTNHYMGKSLRKAHAKMAIGDTEFDAIAEHLAKTLEALNIAPDLIGEVMMIIASTRKDVLNR